MNLVKVAVSSVVPQSVKSYALSTAEYLSPVITESRFPETGMLTPEEFVAAGDMLVSKCPTWQWSAGDAAKVRPHLPPEKQFLVTRSVPCQQRAADLGPAPGDEAEFDDDGWTATPAPGRLHSRAPAQDDGRATVAGEGTSTLGLAPRPPATDHGAAQHADGDDDVPDMKDFEEEGLADEDDAAAMGMASLSVADGSGAGPSNRNILRTRTYDIHVTYDKYYRCGRVWLSGYTEERQPLTNAQLLEDVSSEHANKTCTMEPHPHLEQGLFASIHPCKHAEVMQKLCEQLSSAGREFRVDQYMFLFLKFISTMIPTIDYDYTVSFTGFQQQ